MVKVISATGIRVANVLVKKSSAEQARETGLGSLPDTGAR